MSGIRPAALVAFGRSDLRSVRREPLLVAIVAAPVLLVAVLRAVDAFDVPVPAPFAVAFLLVVLVPFLFGLLVGMLLLDERDGHVLEALRVTPLSLDGYLRYRLGLATAASALLLGLAVPASGMVPAGALPQVMPTLLGAALFAPIPALLLAAFSRNTVEGLAVVKVYGLVLFLPLSAWFLDSRWELLFGIVPTYWPVRAFWEAEAGGTWWPFAVLGVLYDLALTAWLLRVTRRR